MNSVGHAIDGQHEVQSDSRLGAQGQPCGGHWRLAGVRREAKQKHEEVRIRRSDTARYDSAPDNWMSQMGKLHHLERNGRQCAEGVVPLVNPSQELEGKYFRFERRTCDQLT